MESADAINHELWTVHEEGVVRALTLHNADVRHALSLLIDFLSDIIDSAASHLGTDAEGLNKDNSEPVAFKNGTFDKVLLNLFEVQVDWQGKLLLVLHHGLLLVEHLLFDLDARLNLTDDLHLLGVRVLKAINHVLRVHQFPFRVI